MRTDDFTRLPVGRPVSQSRVVIRCPRCSRHGALESSADGARRCIHVEFSTKREGVFDVTDHCDLVGPRSEAVNRAMRERRL